MVKKIKKYLTKNEFLKNSVIMISGTALAQLLPIALSPILTRLYSPEDFGVLAIFTSLSVILIIFGTAKYDMAILLPKKDDYGINLLFLTFAIAAFVALVSFLLILIFHDKIIAFYKVPKLSLWLYFVPLVVFFLAGRTALVYFFMRFKNFKLISGIKIAGSSSTSVVQIGLFWTKNGTLSLITGYITGHIIAFGVLIKSLFKRKDLLKKVKRVKMIALARQYKKFPMIQMPSALIGRFSRELPNLLITPIFDAHVLGLFSLGFRILSAPSSLIGTSVSQVFMQHVNEELQKKGNVKQIFKSVLKKLLIVSIPIFLIFGLFSQTLFSFVFGKEWAESGLYVQILSPMFFVRFVTVAQASVLYVLEKHKLIFNLQLSMLILALAVFGVTYLVHFGVIQFFVIYSITFTLYYLVYFYFIWHSVKKIA